MAERLNLGDLVYRLGFESEDEFLAALERTLNQAEDDVKKSAKRSANAFSGAFRNEFVTAFSGAAIGAAVATTLIAAFSQTVGAVRQFVDSSIREFQTFQISLNTLSASGVENLSAVRSEITRLTNESKVFSESQIAQALSELIKAGLDAGRAVEFLGASINVARSEINPATGELGDLRTISLQLSDVMSAFGIAAADAGRATDVLASGALASKLSISELAQAIGPVGGLAKTAGLSLEQTVASLAQLRSTGISASEAATQLRTVLQAAITPPENLRKQMQALGLTLIDASGKIRPFNELLGNIQRVAAAGGRGLEFLSQAFGSYGVNAAINLGKARQAVLEQVDALSQAEGSAKRFGDQMLQGIEPTKQLAAQISNAKRALGEELQPVLLAFYRDIAPALIQALKDIIALYKDWQFIIHGTTPEIEQMNRQLQETLAARFGIEGAQQFQANVDKMLELGEQQNKLQARLDSLLAQRKNYQSEKQFQFIVGDELDRLRAKIAELEQQRKLLQEENAAILKNKSKPQSAPEKKPPQKQAPPPPIPQPGVTAKTQTDPIVKQAQDLSAQLKILADRYALGQLSAEQYQTAVERLRRQLEALQKSASTAERKSAILSGLTEAKRSLEDLEKRNVAARLASLNAELERQQKLFADIRDVNRYAGALADIEKKAANLRSGVKSEDAKREIDALLKRVADGRRDLTNTLASLGEQAAEFLSSEAKRRLEAIYGDGVQATIAAVRRSYPDFRAAFEGLLAEGMTFDDARLVAALAFPSSFIDSLAEIWGEGLATAAQRAGERAVDEFYKIPDELKRQTDAVLLRLRVSDMSIDDLLGLSPELLSEWVQQLERYGIDAQEEIDRLKTAITTLTTDPAAIERAIRSANEYGDEIVKTGRAVVDGSDYAAVGLDKFKNSLEALAAAAGTPLAAIQQLAELEGELKSALAAGFSDSQETERAQMMLDAVSALLDRLSGSLARAEMPLDRFTRSQGELREGLQITIDGFTYYLDTLEQFAALVQNIPDDELITLFSGLEAEAAAGNEQAMRLLNTLRQIILARSQAFGEAPGRTPGYQDYRRGEREGYGTDQGMDAYERDRQQRQEEPQKQLQQFEAQLADIALSFPRALIRGLQEGDVAGALKQALGSAADFFLNQMLEAILGPIAQQLAASIASSVAAGSAAQTGAGAAAGLDGINPTTLAIGAGLLLLSFLFNKPQPAQTKAAERSPTASAATINYNVAATLNATLQGDLSDPATRAELRTLIRGVAVDLLREVKLLR